MDIKDMKAFFSVVEEGNISHAATRLKVAQPALSRQMKRLEEQLRVQLFERGSRKIRLTEEGKLLYARVEHILGMIEGTMRELGEIGNGISGAIHLGTITTSGALILPELIDKFHGKYPKITFQIWESDGARILELLNNRIIEIAITRTEGDKNLYESIELPEEPLILIMNKDFAGGKKESMRLLELKEKPLIVPLRWADILREKCRQQGFEPNLVCVSDSIVQDVLCVKRGIGIALLPKAAENLFANEDVVSLKLVDPEITSKTVVSWLKNQRLSAASKHFIDLFQEMFLAEKEKGGK